MGGWVEGEKGRGEEGKGEKGIGGAGRGEVVYLLWISA